MASPLRIGTRGSQLALWQARTVATKLEAAGASVDLVIIRTSGDHLQDRPLSEIGGKRLFVKELEDALIRNEIDAAVHSAKDMSAILPEGLTVAATLSREDPRDALVLPAGQPAGSVADVLGRLPANARIGTGSIRRSAQLCQSVPGASFAPVRGNVDTRLARLDGGEYDLLVLAAAGLRRLGFGNRIAAAVPVDQCVPAPGQGIIAIEIRTADTATARALQIVHDLSAAHAFEAERSLVAALGGGCQLPLGALAVVRGAALDLHAVVCSSDGSRAVRARSSGPLDAASALGVRVAAELASAGAVELLDQAKNAQS